MKESLAEKVSRLNDLFTEIQDYKMGHPNERTGYYTSSIASLLNAYREGDVGFDECIALIQVAKSDDSVQEMTRSGELLKTIDKFKDALLRISQTGCGVPGHSVARNCGAQGIAESALTPEPPTKSLSDSPVTAFHQWQLDRLKDGYHKALTSAEYAIAMEAFYAAHPGQGPVSYVMTDCADNSRQELSETISRLIVDCASKTERHVDGLWIWARLDFLAGRATEMIRDRVHEHSKAIGVWLSEMAEIYSLDVELGDDMKVEEVCEKLLEIARASRDVPSSEQIR